MTHPLLGEKKLLRSKLEKSNSVVVGIFFYSGDSAIAEAAAVMGTDFLIIDMEASSMNSRDVVTALQSLNGSTCTGIVRVQSHEQHLIGHALDCGAAGVMIPKIETAEEARTLSDALRYPPRGTRGINAFRATAYGVDEERYMQNSNSEALCIVQLESPQAILEVDNIASLANVDVVFIGMGDLTLSAGIFGQTEHPTIIEMRKHVIQSCLKNKKIPGIFAGSPDLANKYIEEGFRFIAMTNDVKFFCKGLSSALDAIKHWERPS